MSVPSTFIPDLCHRARKAAELGLTVRVTQVEWNEMRRQLDVWTPEHPDPLGDLPVTLLGVPVEVVEI